ncbi:vitellogenin-like [Prorops nasuta]|uniref:vitellogenin-like n=1 Tax=Prorops nasuta TaxID=863751 RepID=UPI0034CE4FEB
MWSPFILLLLVGAALGNNHAWKTGQEYQYLVRSRTMTALDKLNDRYSGIVIKALLKIQPRQDNEDVLAASIYGAKYAPIHTELEEGWDTPIPESNMQLRELPLTGKPFEIKMKHGVIRDLVVDKSVPTWEVNLLKSIVSQLQVDTQAENAKDSPHTQVPRDDQPYATFKAMEDTVGGKCEVLYDITPLPQLILQSNPELVPLPHLDDQQYIEVFKTKNYTKCEQRMGYHFGITGSTEWEPGTNDNSDLLTKASNSRIILSGKLHKYTIQSSVTTNMLTVSPMMYDNNGLVIAVMNLTLARVEGISQPLESPNEPESTGNLVYTYSNPFSDGEERKSRKPSVSWSSKEATGDSRRFTSSRGDDRRSESWDDSASMNSISSSEEDNFWQNRPSMNEAPESPLLPYFIGYKGKSIGKSKVDIIKSSKDLIMEIAEEIEHPSRMTEDQTLEKFTILTRLMRTMSTKQLKEIVKDHSPESENQLNGNHKMESKKQAAWEVTRDAIAQTGTGPALMVIKDWIEKKHISSMDACNILSRLSQTVRTPTIEYLETFFELINRPEVTEHYFVNTSAIISFTDLVHSALVDSRSLHNHYPVHSFGRMVSKHNKFVLEKVIPHLEQQLKNAVKEGNSPKIQTYIVALGNVGHPRILSVFEPYLEGKHAISRFQRLLMVLSLNNLAMVHPKLARSVLYKIYKNTQEYHDLRCAAVLLLMTTNPDLVMLQRMADFTSYDHSRHVNSVVRSSINSLAKLRRPESQQLARNARTASELLSNDEDSYILSHSSIKDAVLSDDLAYSIIHSYIGSDDSEIPRAWYIAVALFAGKFNAPDMSLGYMVSSPERYIHAIESMFTKKEKSDSKESMTETISKLLKIQDDEPEQLEGNFFANRWFLPYDNHTIERLGNAFRDAMSSMKDGHQWRLTRFISRELTMSFPMESGLPFVYTMKNPVMWKSKLHAKLGFESIEKPIAAHSKLHMTFATQFQGRIGFVAPFEHHHYMAGVDMNRQFNLPIQMDFDIKPTMTSAEVKIRPISDEKQIKLMHSSIVPFTSRHNILDLKCLSKDKNTHPIHITIEPQKISLNVVNNKVETFVLSTEMDVPDPIYDSISNKKFTKSLLFPWSNVEHSTYRKMDLLYTSSDGKFEPLVLTFNWDSLNKDVEGPSDFNGKPKAPKIKAEQNDEDRIKELLTESARGIKSVSAGALDIGLQIPRLVNSKYFMTVAHANSFVDNRTRTLMALRFEDKTVPDTPITAEMCFSGRSSSPMVPQINFDEALKSRPEMTYEAEIRVGPTCYDEQSLKIEIDSLMRKTGSWDQWLEEEKVTKKCKREMERGNKATQACQDAMRKTMMMDSFIATVLLDGQPSNAIMQMIEIALESIEDKTTTVTKMFSSFNPPGGKQVIDIYADIEYDTEMVNIGVQTAPTARQWKNINLKKWEIDPEAIFSSSDNLELNYYPEHNRREICVIDKNEALTFDGRSYSLKLGQCSHVMMTAFQMTNPDNNKERLPIPREHRVSLIVKDRPDGTKTLKIALDDNTIEMTGDSPMPTVTLNGGNVKIGHYFRKTRMDEESQEEETEFEIFKPMGDKIVKLISDRFGVSVVFDGERVLLKLSDDYRNSIRGLCGNYDGHSENDLLTPRNCVMKKAEEFTATYALTNEKCEGPAVQNAQKAKEASCLRMNTRFSNVISEREAGRRENNEKWGHHATQQRLRSESKHCASHRTKVIEENGQICFTMRPVVTCGHNCMPVNMKMKKYDLHCMPNSEAARNMKKRIEDGANPDFSQKQKSEEKDIEVAIGCAPAA